MELRVLSQKLFGFTLHRHINRHLRDHFIPHEGNDYHPHVLRHQALFFYTAFLLLVKITALSGPLLVPYAPAESSAITPENIIALTNQSRRNSNLPELAPSPQLAVAASNKARDMMSKGYFAHFSPEGVSPWYWITSSGYNYSYAGENLAIRFSTAEGVNDAWLASPAHRANILSKDFKEIGIAVLTDTYGQEGAATLVVQMFGAQATAASSAPASQAADFKPVVIAKKSPDKTADESAQMAAPQILFPLNNSFVNKSRFEILGRADDGANVELYLENKLFGEAAVSSARTFKYYPPEDKALADGPYSLYARAKSETGETSAKSQAVNFSIDTAPPLISKDRVSVLPEAGDGTEYRITATVSPDSIRTIVSIGSDSAVLERGDDSTWRGKIKLLNLQKGQNVPIDVFSQDIAGNESRLRVGWLDRGDVRGVFGSGTELAKTSGGFTVLGLFAIPDFGKLANNFYLLFTAFISASLILMIGIKRHIQHPKTIAAASSVAMLAAILFMI